MKNRNCRLLFVVLAAVGVMLLTACNDLFDVLSDTPVDTQKDAPKVKPIKKGYGSVTIVVGGGEKGRTIMPDDPSLTIFEKIVFTFTDTEENSELPPQEADEDFVFELTESTYSLLVEAYNGGSIVASGTASDIVVETGKNTPVEIKLTPETSGTGKFKYDITYPSGATLTMTLTNWVNNSDGLAAHTPTTNTLTQRAGTVDNLDNGSYLLTVKVDNGTNYAGFVEIVRIFPTLTTTLPPKTFASTDLVEKTRRSISLNGGDLDFAAIAGYGAITPKEVEITNTGNVPTGDLTVSLEGVNPSAFELSELTSGTVASIAKDGTGTFKVAPKTGATSGSYSALIKVEGTGISETITVTFEVSVAHYEISIDQSGTYTFTDTDELEVTVTNEGNVATGVLNVALSNTSPSNGFTVGGSPISSLLTNNATATFTIAPNSTGLTMGTTYTATVTVSGGNGITASFNVSYTVPKYGITLSESSTPLSSTEPLTFTAVPVGYGAQTAKTVIITNPTGNEPTGTLTVALSGGGASNFTLDPSNGSISSINANATNSFTVTPNTGLSAGTYTETVTVSNANIVAGTTNTFTVSFTVATPSISISNNNGSGNAVTNGGTFTFATKPSSPTYTPEVLTVLVTNNGSVPTNALTASLSGTNSSSFTLSGTGTIGVISNTGSNTATFTVEPIANLPAKETAYTAIVTIEGTGLAASQTFTVSFTVNPPDGVSISISWTEPTNPTITGPTTASVGQNVTLNTEAGATSYEWRVNSELAPGINNASSYDFQYWLPGKYTVNVLVVKAGEPYTAEFDITVQ